MALSPADCCNAAGGRIIITANGQQWSARAAVTVIPIGYQRDSGSNQDGTLYTTYKPMPYEAEMVLSDFCGMKIEDIMGCPINVTIQLVDVSRTYYFTSAVVVGRPAINTETGEIRGLKVQAGEGNFRYVNN